MVVVGSVHTFDVQCVGRSTTIVKAIATKRGMASSVIIRREYHVLGAPRVCSSGRVSASLNMCVVSGGEPQNNSTTSCSGPQTGV